MKINTNAKRANDTESQKLRIFLAEAAQFMKSLPARIETLSMMPDNQTNGLVNIFQGILTEVESRTTNA
jgi:hypothetical protein